MFFIRVITAKTKIFILAQNFPMPWIRVLACGILKVPLIKDKTNS